MKGMLLWLLLLVPTGCGEESMSALEATDAMVACLEDLCREPDWTQRPMCHCLQRGRALNPDCSCSTLPVHYLLGGVYGRVAVNGRVPPVRCDVVRRNAAQIEAQPEFVQCRETGVRDEPSQIP